MDEYTVLVSYTLNNQHKEVTFKMMAGSMKQAMADVTDMLNEYTRCAARGVSVKAVEATGPEQLAKLRTELQDHRERCARCISGRKCDTESELWTSVNTLALKLRRY